MEREAMIFVESQRDRDGQGTGSPVFKADSVQRALLNRLKIAINKMGCSICVRV
jgi:hypothetical protein